MAPPSKLAVATGSVTRLVKEEASYHKELVQQEERIKKLEASEGDENKEYTLRQEVSSNHYSIISIILHQSRSKHCEKPKTSSQLFDRGLSRRSRSSRLSW